MSLFGRKDMWVAFYVSAFLHFPGVIKHGGIIAYTVITI
jgi:hypothetical protein